MALRKKPRKRVLITIDADLDKHIRAVFEDSRRDFSRGVEWLLVRGLSDINQPLPKAAGDEPL